MRAGSPATPFAPSGMAKSMRNVPGVVSVAVAVGVEPVGSDDASAVIFGAGPVAPVSPLSPLGTPNSTATPVAFGVATAVAADPAARVLAEAETVGVSPLSPLGP